MGKPTDNPSKSKSAPFGTAERFCRALEAGGIDPMAFMQAIIDNVPFREAVIELRKQFLMAINYRAQMEAEESLEALNNPVIPTEFDTEAIKRMLAHRSFSSVDRKVWMENEELYNRITSSRGFCDLIQLLDPKEANILIRKWGLANDGALPVAQISEDMNLTVGRVREILKKAQAKLWRAITLLS